MPRYQLQISAKILQWPGRCACCGGPATQPFRAIAKRTTGKRVVRTISRWWEVGHCAACAKHRDMANQARMLLTGSLIGSVIFAFVLSGMGVPQWGAGLILLTIAGAGIFGYVKFMEFAKAAMLPTCSGLNAPVVYTEWYGTMHTLIFTSESYLQDFIALNHGKTMSDVRRVP